MEAEHIAQDSRVAQREREGKKDWGRSPNQGRSRAPKSYMRQHGAEQTIGKFVDAIYLEMMPEMERLHKALKNHQKHL